MSQPNPEVITSDDEKAQQVPLVDSHKQQQQVLTLWLRKNKQGPGRRPQLLHPLVCKGLVAVACVLTVSAVLPITTAKWNSKWLHQDVLENKDHEVDSRLGNEDLCRSGGRAGSKEGGPVFPMSFEGPHGGCPESWTCTGEDTQICALGSKTRVCNHPGIDNVEGTHYFNVGNDLGTGSATSSTFVLPEAIYSVFFSRSGGADEGSGVYIIRHSDDKVICAAEEGQNSNAMVEQWCNKLGKYAGQSVYILIKDSQSTDWGKVMVDNFRLLDKSGNDLNPERNTTEVMHRQGEPTHKNCFLKKSGYISPGGDIFQEKLTPKAAKAKCREMQDCCGITYEDSPEAAANMSVLVYFKGVCDSGEDGWKSYYFERNLEEHSGHHAKQPSDRQHAASHSAHHEAGGQEHGHGRGHEEEHGHEEHGHEGHGHGGDAHGGHGEHGHGAELVSKVVVDQAVAGMLLGSIAFHTSLFYLVNFNDDDMKRHSWSVLSSTIAIFSAVMVFKGFNGVLKYLVQLHLHHDGFEVFEMIGLAYLEMFMFFAALQYRIYRIASRELEDREDEEQMMNQEQRMQCWSTILAHMSAFAAMDAGVQMQMTETLAKHTPFAFVPVVLNIGILFILFRIADHIRAGCVRFGCKHEVLLQWDEVSEEGENDFGGLGISFLLAEAIKYCITGEFTHSAMRHHHRLHPSVHDALHQATLFLACLAFAGLSVFVVWLREQRKKRSKAKASEVVREVSQEHFVIGDFNNYMKRWFFIFQTVFAMSFAWCLLSTLTWTMAKLLDDMGFFFGHHTTGQHTAIALMVSFLAFCLIRILDLIEDMEATGDVTDKCVRSMIESIAILIGFSWEHAFEVGVGVIAELTIDRGDWCPVFAKFMLAFAVALVVIPAWRLYILKNVLKLRQEHREKGIYASSPLRRM